MSVLYHQNALCYHFLPLFRIDPPIFHLGHFTLSPISSILSLILIFLSFLYFIAKFVIILFHFWNIYCHFHLFTMLYFMPPLFITFLDRFFTQFSVLHRFPSLFTCSFLNFFYCYGFRCFLLAFCMITVGDFMDGIQIIRLYWIEG